MAEEKLTRYEQEVHLSFNMEDENVRLYTSSTVWLKKMNALVEKYPDEFKCIDTATMQGEVVARSYEFPLKYFKIGKPRQELSEERKEELRARLSGFRQDRKNKE